MLSRGETVDAIRELIAIPHETEKILREYVAEHPGERQSIERVIEFRQLVGQEFERLYRAQSLRRSSLSHQNVPRSLFTVRAR